MANKDVSPKEWLKRINRAKKYRDQVKDKQNWSRLMDEYEGDYRVNNQSIKAPPINIVYGYIHTAIPKLYFRDPYISVNAKGSEYIQRAHILESVVNYLMSELGIKKEIAKVLIDTLLIGHGWLKYGFASEIGDMEQTSKDNNPIDAPVSNTVEYVKNQEIFVVHVPWEDVLFDVTLCKDPPYDCRWIAHRIIKPLDSLKDSKNYKNTGGLKSNVSVRDMKGNKVEEAIKDSDLDLFEFWEIWDKDSNKILVVAEGTDKFLRDDLNVYEMEGLPFSMLKFNPVPGKPYPLSDIYLIEPQILERIKLRQAQINHIKRWSRQLSIESGTMTEKELEKFAQGIDGAVTQRTKGSAPPVPIQYAPIPEESFQVDDLIQRDMDSVIGQNDVERGGQARTKTKTLGELREQQIGTATRSQRRQDLLEDFLEEVFDKVISLVKQFQTTPKYVRITGMNPEEVVQKLGPNVQYDGTGIKFTKDDIQGEYDIEVKAGSTLPMNKENRIKVMEMLLNVGPRIGILPGSPVATAIGRELIRELDLKEAEQAFEEQAAMIQAGNPAMPPSGQPMPAPHANMPRIPHQLGVAPGIPGLPVPPVSNGMQTK